MNNLLKRSFSGIIYILIFLSAILFSEKSYLLLISIFGLFSIWEFSKMIKSRNIISYIFFGLLLFLMIDNQDGYLVKGILITTIVSSLFLLYQLISKKEILYFNNISKFGLTLRYVVFSMCFLILLPFFNNIFRPYLIISILSIIWVNDSFAFLVGKNFGNKKLFVSVSPNKTVEGFLGGLVFSLLASFLISQFNTLFTLNSWLVIGALVSVLGTLGDLIESKFKRQAKIKDSGSLMPGHGGILDRLDSLLFVSPFVYLYINFII